MNRLDSRLPFWMGPSPWQPRAWSRAKLPRPGRSATGWLVASLLPLSLLASGCSPCGIGPTKAQEYLDGHVSTSGLMYETSHVGDEFLHFPSGHSFDLVHGLGVPPTSVHGYVSFVPRLTDDGDAYDPLRPNNLSEAAGNQMVVERWNDQVIRIRNDTCADFYVRVVAYVDEAASQGGMGAAGAPSN